MDLAGDDFLAGPRLTLDKDRCVGARDELDLLHDAAQSRIGADDRLTDIVAPELGKEGAVLSLERLAKAQELAEPAVVLKSRGERLQERFRERLVIRLEASQARRRAGPGSPDAPLE